MTKVLVLPGLSGSDEGHWQRYWLEDQQDSELVEQSDWTRPDIRTWMQKLESTLDKVGDAYIVAHSLGCVLAANLADSASAKRVRGALLVAPCDLYPTNRLHPEQITFGTMPTKGLPFPSIIVGSLNDIYMSIDRLTLFGRLWNSEVRNIGLAGHINIASGFGRWPTGYAMMERLKRRTGHAGSTGKKVVAATI